MKKIFSLLLIIISSTINTNASESTLSSSSQSSSDEVINFCIFCQNDIRRSQKTDGPFLCRHFFHEFCVDRWMESQKKDTCPTCRAKMALPRKVPRPVNLARVAIIGGLPSNSEQAEHFNRIIANIQEAFAELNTHTDIEDLRSREPNIQAIQNFQNRT